MGASLKQFGLSAIEGRDSSFVGMLVRATAAAIEPFYSAAMTIRNRCYDRGIFASGYLGRPTISVGNITTGGTGKTPVVRWFADELRSRGHRPAILLRGYGSADAGTSDEGALLDRVLNAEDQPIIPVQPCPSRIAGAARVLAQHPQVNLFLLDDGFQHRRAKRDFNLVLISATNPFGYGHVLPRGLLRESLKGLGRADAFIITRCGQVDEAAVRKIDQYLSLNHPRTPVYHCDHQHTGLWLPIENRSLPMTAIAGEKIFLTAAIGDPKSFRRQIETNGCQVIGEKWFDDHHTFSPADVNAISAAATAASAQRLITTEKDWVKLSPLLKEFTPPIAVVQLRVQFQIGDGERLLAQAHRAVERASFPGSS